MISLYSPFIACISATLSRPIFGAGFGGGGGGKSFAPAGATDVVRLKGLPDDELLPSGVWMASLASENVRRAVRMTISKPLRSSMSNLMSRWRRKRLGIDLSKDRYAPIEIVVQDLDSGCLQPPCWLFRDGNDNRWVWFSNNEALFSFPFEFIAISPDL